MLEPVAADPPGTKTTLSHLEPGVLQLKSKASPWFIHDGLTNEEGPQPTARTAVGDSRQ